MELETLKATDNPELANKLLSEVAETADPVVEATITRPADNEVELPGGYLTFSGEILKTAEVRELNGKDEEALGKATNVARMWQTLLTRAVVSIGGERASESVLDNMLAGDRDALLLGIYRVTYGNEATLQSYCDGCREVKEVNIDINSDIKTKILVDPVADRRFTVHGKKNEYVVNLPTGLVSKALGVNPDLTYAETVTLLLEKTIQLINDQPVMGKNQILNINVVDRKKIVEAIADRNIGPQFDDIVITCPSCEGELVVPISLGALFQF